MAEDPLSASLERVRSQRHQNYPPFATEESFVAEDIGAGLETKYAQLRDVAYRLAMRGKVGRTYLLLPGTDRG